MMKLPAQQRRDFTKNVQYGKCVGRKENTQSHYRFMGIHSFAAGQEYEEESGLYNFRARMYFDDEVLFGQTDPANQTFAPYSYCLGNPINYVDPTGRVVDAEEERKRQVKFWEFMAEAEQWNLRESLEKTSSTSWAKRLFQVSYKNISYAQAWLKVLKSGHYEYERDGDETYEYPGTYSVTINQRVKPLWVEDDTPWMNIAKGEVGQSEIAGQDNNYRIVEYHLTTTLRANNDETPWCSSFVNWVFKQSVIRGTRSASALSWKKWGQNLSKPAYGSIAIIDYGKGRGHVGFVAGVDESGSIVLLGGNQGNAVSYSNVSTSKIHGYVYPRGYNPSYNLPVIHSGSEMNYASTR